MPQLPQVLAQTSPSGPVGGRRAASQEFGGEAAQGLLMFGQAVGNVGQQVDAVMQQVQQANKEKVKLFEMQKSSEILNKVKDYNSLQDQRLSEASDNIYNFAEIEQEGFDQLVNDVTGDYTFTNPEIALKLNNQILDARRSSISNAFTIQNKAIKAKTQQTLYQETDDLGAKVAAGQLDLESAIAQVSASLESGRGAFSPDEYLKTSENLKSRLQTKALSNLVFMNPEVAEDMLMSEEGEKYLPSLRQSFLKEAQRRIEVQEREIDKLRDEQKIEAFNELSVKALDGNLTVTEVELRKDQLGDQFPVVMRMAKEQNPVSNKQVVGNLNAKVYSGDDVTTELMAARMDGLISNEDFTNLLGTQRTILQQGFTDSVEVNRRFVIDSLGGLKKDLDSQSSTVIANASIQYEIDIQKFQEEKNRRPSLLEAKNIADGVIDKFQVYDLDAMVINLPKPEFLDIHYKTKPKDIDQQVIKEVKRKTVNKYLKIHNGNKEAASTDPSLLQQMKMISSFEEVARRNEINKENKLKKLAK